VPKSQNPRLPVVAEIPQWLTALEMVETSDDVATDMGERIMRAETVEQMLDDDNETQGLRDIVGHVIEVHSATLRRSDNPDGLGAFAVIQATDDGTGDQLVLTCGAAKVLRKLVKAQHEGWYPFKAQVTETPSKSNPTRTVLNLVAPEKPF
jgi:hypothetical protein